MISTQKNKVKKILLIFLIFILLALIVAIIYQRKYLDVIKNATQGQKTEKNIIDGITINGIDLNYDSNSNTYYLPINLVENEQITLKITIYSNYNIKSKIGDKEFAKQIKFDEKISYDKEFQVDIESLLYKQSCAIKFTNIPSISLNFDEKEIGNEYTYSEFSITNPNYKENNSEYQYYADSKVRYRGSSTAGYPKKSYRIKLEKNIDFGLLGMNKSKTWLLDALVTDSSCLRTKIASDIWNKMNEDLNTEEHIDLNAKFVELYVNGEYIGLYLLKETIDENLLKLDKDTGVLLKGIDWNQIDFGNYDNIQEEKFGPFEIKYPEKQKEYPRAWKRILDKLKKYYIEDMSYENMEKIFYKENFVNHRIFILLTQALDNYEYKNIYYSITNDKENTKVLITPWDLDLTFAMLWDENELNYTKQYERVNEIVEPIGIITDDKTKEYYKERWKYLSQTSLDIEKINKLIDEQVEYLTKANAFERENIKNQNIEHKKNVNMEEEKEEIKDWYKKRFEVIENYINSL